MRLIDADKLEIRKLAEFNDEYGDAVPVYGVEAEDIDNAPTVDAIVLPVKVGQTVWTIRHNPHEGYVIKENQAVNIGMRFSKCSEVCITVVTTKEDILGKTVFLTREAAEAALKAREKQNNA